MGKDDDEIVNLPVMIVGGLIIVAMAIVTIIDIYASYNGAK